MSLFDISAGIDYKACDCAKYLSGMHLPSTRSMWNSRTASEWEKEYMLSPVQSDFGGLSYQLLTFGDLLSYQDHNDGNGSDSSSNSSVVGLLLNDWLAHADEMGTLVMSAAKFSENAYFAK